jgi:nicotinamide-nucleotide amidase
MLAEVISIGDELTSGQRLDTNSQWLAERLGELGVRTLYHTTVADDMAANVRVFREALDRAEVIVVTGGLGPTADDLTRQALAAAVGVELELDPGSLEHIQAMFARRKREMPPANRVQALFPQGSRVVPNPHGTAPGIDLTVARANRSSSRVFCLPGVPAEMREMWTATVEPAIAVGLGGERQVIRHYCVKCFGVGESDLEQMLPDLIRRGRDPVVGITVSKATITLRVTAIAESPDACAAKAAPTLETIHQCLGNLIYGYADDELQQVVARRLRALGQTVATVESFTRGWLGSWLADAAVGSDSYAGGELVRDSLRHPALPGGSSYDVGEWAIAARVQRGADYGLAIGPRRNSPEKSGPEPSQATSPGEVEIALATSQGVQRTTFSLAGHPDILVPRTVKQALNVLRLAVVARDADDPKSRDNPR